MQVNTNENTLIAKIVGLVIALVVLGMVLVPFVNETTTTEKTFTNEGLWLMKPFEEGDEWVMSEPGVWTYNGEDVLTTDNSTSSVMIGDDWTVRGTGAIFGHTIYNASPSTVTITVGESSTTINTGTVNSVEGYGVTNDGDYIVTKYDKPVYVHGDSPIWATGYTAFAGVSCVMHIEGTIKDGVTVTCSTINNTSALSNFVITNLSINAVKDSTYLDLYKLESITFTVTCDYTTGGVTTEKTGDITYSSYVVPASVTAELSQHPGNIEITLYQMIPILIVLGLIVAIVGMFAYNRHGN